MIVVLNKIDIIPSRTRQEKISKITTRMRSALTNTWFGSNVPIVPIASNPTSESTESCEWLQSDERAESVTSGTSGGGSSVDSVPALEGRDSGRMTADPEGLDELVQAISKHVYIPKRDSSGPLCFVYDHCFNIKGQGSVLTGTVTSGKVSVGDTVEESASKIRSKVRSIQSFKQSVCQAWQGDRVAVCCPGLKAKFERGMLCSPAHPLITIDWCVAQVHRVRYFRQPILSKVKFNCTINHRTVLCTPTFFKCPANLYRPPPPVSNPILPQSDDPASPAHTVDTDHFVSELDVSIQYTPVVCWTNGHCDGGRAAAKGGRGRHGHEQRVEEGDEREDGGEFVFAVLKFDKPMQCLPYCKFICCKLDLDSSSQGCRIAFWGHLLHPLVLPSSPEPSSVKQTRLSTAVSHPPPHILPPRTPDSSSSHSRPSPSSTPHRVCTPITIDRLMVMKDKVRRGQIDRLLGGNEAIVRDLFNDSEHLMRFLGYEVFLVLHVSGCQRVDTSSRMDVPVSSWINNAGDVDRGCVGVEGKGELTDSQAGKHVEGDSGVSVREVKLRGVIQRSFGGKGKCGCVFVEDLTLWLSRNLALEEVQEVRDAQGVGYRKRDMCNDEEEISSCKKRHAGLLEMIGHMKDCKLDVELLYKKRLFGCNKQGML
eukprot:GHVQ01000266.1.p1 GENE.GHVQ01000266.1~~GHVQ01000266.1.p1  ORF type:complete len:652 (-),score=105.84 GHVQ01000266.1:386-2341(-)